MSEKPVEPIESHKLTFGESLVLAAQQMLDDFQGRKPAARVTRIPLEADVQFSTEEARAIREGLGLDEEQFGELISASAESVREWEEGRVPIQGLVARMFRQLERERPRFVREAAKLKRNWKADRE